LRRVFEVRDWETFSCAITLAHIQRPVANTFVISDNVETLACAEQGSYDVSSLAIAVPGTHCEYAHKVTKPYAHPHPIGHANDGAVSFSEPLTYNKPPLEISHRASIGRPDTEPHRSPFQ
jgi:hypothetical protein